MTSFGAKGARLTGAWGVVLLLVPTRAAAEDFGSSALAIEWRAPSECPDEASLRGGVERLFGGSIPGTELSVRAELAAEAPGYALVLETTAEGHHGVKHLHDASCEELTRAAAVLIALAIDPNLALSEKDAAAWARTPDAPLAESPARSETQRTSPAETGAGEASQSNASPSKTAGAAPVLAGDGSVAALGEVGTVPGFAPGVLVQMNARLGVGLLGMGGEYLAPQRTQVPGRPEIGALVGYVGGEAFGCVGAFAHRAAPAACAGVNVGSLSGESRGAPVQGHGSLLWVTPEVGGSFRYGLRGPVLLEGGVMLRFAVQDSEFTLDNVGRVYAPSAVAVRVHLGGVFRLF
jgi:hypothetical protein